MSQRINSTDFLKHTAMVCFCASEKGVRKKQMPDFVVDKRKIVEDPVSGKKYFMFVA